MFDATQTMQVKKPKQRNRTEKNQKEHIYISNPQTPKPKTKTAEFPPKKKHTNPLVLIPATAPQHRPALQNPSYFPSNPGLPPFFLVCTPFPFFPFPFPLLFAIFSSFLFCKFSSLFFCLS